MHLIPLPKQETKLLVQDTYDIDNSLNSVDDSTYRLRTMRLSLLQSWRDSHNLPANNVKIHWNFLTNLFNVKPYYNYRDYEYKNAIWGFGWKLDQNSNNKFILYKSIRGLSVELHENFDVTMIDDFLDELINLLVNKNNIHPMLKEICQDIL